MDNRSVDLYTCIHSLHFVLQLGKIIFKSIIKHKRMTLSLPHGETKIVLITKRFFSFLAREMHHFSSQFLISKFSVGIIHPPQKKEKYSEDCRCNNQNGGPAAPLNINPSLKDPCGAFHWFVCCCNVSSEWLNCAEPAFLWAFSIRLIFW